MLRAVMEKEDNMRKKTGNVSREMETFKNQKEMLEISTLWENEGRLWGVHQ